MSNPLFAKKTLDQLIAESKVSGEHSLKKTLGPFQLTALGVGAVIGAGIFVFSGLGAHYAGPGLMLSFVISGLGCAFAALCYAEFAAMIPVAGPKDRTNNGMRNPRNASSSQSGPRTTTKIANKTTVGRLSSIFWNGSGISGVCRMLPIKPMVMASRGPARKLAVTAAIGNVQPSERQNGCP